MHKIKTVNYWMGSRKFYHIEDFDGLINELARWAKEGIWNIVPESTRVKICVENAELKGKYGLKLVASYEGVYPDKDLGINEEDYQLLEYLN